jgi:hypothetical protein
LFPSAEVSLRDASFNVHAGARRAANRDLHL